MGGHKHICKGCGNTGKNVFSKDGFCLCPQGREMKELNDVKVDRYFESLRKR